MDLLDAASYHQLALQAAGRSPATTRLYFFYQRKFLSYLAAQHIEPSLDALNTVNSRAALLWFRGQSNGGSRGGQVSAASLVETLKTWANFLTGEGIYQDSPLRNLKHLRVPKVLRSPFTQAELVALWGACRLSAYPVRDEALFLLLLDTGVRIGEATTITLDKLQLDRHQVVVGLDGKGRRERIVPVGDPTKRDGGRAVRALRRYVSERPATQRDGNRLFIAQGGYALTPEGGTHVIKHLGRLAGVENVHPHRLRHTMATWYLTVHPGDELGLRRIIGHVSRDVINDYVHLSQTTLAQRSGQASLSETMALPSRSGPSLPARGGTPIVTAWSGRPAAAQDTEPSSRADELLALVKADPRLRDELRRALLADGNLNRSVAS